MADPGPTPGAGSDLNAEPRRRAVRAWDDERDPSERLVSARITARKPAADDREP